MERSDHDIRGNRGFSLVEVMVAAGCLAVIAMTTASFAVNNSSRLADDQKETLALQLASNNFEDLLNRYSSDALLAPGGHVLYFDQNGATTTAPSAFFTLAWTITPDQPIANILSIQETVSWVTFNFPRQLRFMTYRSSL